MGADMLELALVFGVLVATYFVGRAHGRDVAERRSHEDMAELCLGFSEIIDDVLASEKGSTMITYYPTIPFKKVNPDAPTPKYAHDGDAGMDLCSMDDVEIAPQGMVKVGCGIAFAIPSGYYGALVPRSGISTKKGITLINTPSTIDSSYRGEVKLPLYNAGTETQVIEKGERVCQIIFKAYAQATLQEVSELPDSERAEAGFGSSGRFYERP